MCSPAQAVGAPSLADEIQELKAASDAHLRGEAQAQRGALRSAERSTRHAEREALVRAGTRFGRQTTIQRGGPQGIDAIRGALSPSVRGR